MTPFQGLSEAAAQDPSSPNFQCNICKNFGHDVYQCDDFNLKEDKMAKMIECSQLRKEALKRKIQLSFEEAFPAEVYDPEFKDDTPEGRAAVVLKKMTTLVMLREIIAAREPRAKKKRSLDHLFKEDVPEAPKNVVPEVSEDKKTVSETILEAPLNVEEPTVTQEVAKKPEDVVDKLSEFPVAPEIPQDVTMDAVEPVENGEIIESLEAVQEVKVEESEAPTVPEVPEEVKEDVTPAEKVLEDPMEPEVVKEFQESVKESKEPEAEIQELKEAEPAELEEPDDDSKIQEVQELNESEKSMEVEASTDLFDDPHVSDDRQSSTSPATNESGYEGLPVDDCEDADDVSEVSDCRSTKERSYDDQSDKESVSSRRSRSPRRRDSKESHRSRSRSSHRSRSRQSRSESRSLSPDARDSRPPIVHNNNHYYNNPRDYNNNYRNQNYHNNRYHNNGDRQQQRHYRDNNGTYRDNKYQQHGNKHQQYYDNRRQQYHNNGYRNNNNSSGYNSQAGSSNDLAAMQNMLSSINPAEVARVAQLMAQTMTPQQQQGHQSNGFKQRPNYQNRYYNNSDRGENCDRNYANRGYQQRDLEDRRSSTGSYSNSRKNYY